MPMGGRMVFLVSDLDFLIFLQNNIPTRKIKRKVTTEISVGKEILK